MNLFRSPLSPLSPFNPYQRTLLIALKQKSEIKKTLKLTLRTGA